MILRACIAPRAARATPLVLTLACAASPPADTVLLGGKIFTADSTRPFVEALAIRGDRVLAVGTTANIAKHVGPATRRIDLAGRVAIPGINDAHVHFSPQAAGWESLPAFSELDPPWSEVRPALIAAVRRLPPGTPIRATVGIRVLDDAKVTRYTLDSIAPVHPIVLSTFYGHGDLLNTRMMRELGVGETDPDPPGGFYERVRGTNRLDGKIFEYAQWRLWQRTAQLGDQQSTVRRLQELSDEALGFGITSLQVMSTSPTLFLETLGASKSPLRVRVIRFPVTGPTGAPGGADTTLTSVPDSGTVTVSGVKWIVDGTPLERGALMRRVYSDRPGWWGRTNFSPAEVTAILRASVARDEPLLLHVVGDSTSAIVLGAMEAMTNVDWPARRLRFEHGDGVTGDLVARAARLGVIVVQNPTHFALPVIAERVPDTVRYQRLRSLHEAGVRIALGSDGPLNPYLNIMLASVHPSAPSEAITRELAVTAYTRNAAYAEFAEAEKGSLAPGKLADIAVLSQDIFTVPPPALPATVSLMTIIGGRVVHDAGKVTAVR